MNRHDHSSSTRGSIAALPTKFRGITFRSRLEARWAVYFYALGIRYEFEPETVTIPAPPPSRARIEYLVDFRLPELQCFAEVKPMRPTTAERWKCEQLSKVTGVPVLLLVGQPSNEWVECVEPSGLGPRWVDLFESYRDGRLDTGDVSMYETDRPSPIERGESHPATLAIQAARGERFGT